MTAGRPGRGFGISGRTPAAAVIPSVIVVAVAVILASAGLVDSAGVAPARWEAPTSPIPAPTPPTPSVASEMAGLSFGVINVHSPERTRTMWEPILADLSLALGRPVTLRPFDDYAGVVWALGASDIDLAWMGNKAAIHAVDTARAEVFVQKLGRQGEAGYRSYLIAGPTTDVVDFPAIVAIAETARRDGGMRRPRLAMGDPNSTSGTLIPTYHLFRGPGVGLHGLFRSVTRGGHEDNFHAVARGIADVGTISSPAFERMCEVEAEECAALRVIWRSPMIPNDPLVWRGGLSAETRAAIRGFFLDYGRDRPGVDDATRVRELVNLALLGAAGFQASDDDQLTPVREIEDFRAAVAP